jgi:hypothetical protein
LLHTVFIASEHGMGNGEIASVSRVFIRISPQYRRG